MRSLLLRLSALDADAAAAVRVIDFFDALAGHRASVEAMVRATAGLAECACGMRLADGRHWRFAPTGESLAGEPHFMSSQVAFEADNVPAGNLWLEREGADGPMDDLVLERACLTARMLLTDHRPRRAAGVVDPSLMEVALSTHESLADRSRALRQLGLIPDQQVRVAALSVNTGRDPAVEAVVLTTLVQPARSAFVAMVGDVAAVVFQQKGICEPPASDLRVALRGRTQDQRLRAGVRIGIGAQTAGVDAQKSWQQALLALRFAPPGDTCRPMADPGEAVIDYDEIGVIALLAEIPPERLASDPYVAALDVYGATENGQLDIATLEAYCRTGSLRRTAQVLYLHHSTVSFRLARIEEAMNWQLDNPADRFCAQFALWARRLLHKSERP
ncbi:hypothetical protein A5685_14700 [Mycobacterium colombiense]|uniref:PucR family transcriptional regulator n=1 Tax=Mycobacterium colombiense TaxID=339268 RepID=A0A1A2RLV7_9MYCO|nr:helix-turn-helix domain-containing protein [Mycobacterium colombiense]OBH52690.1 hypothetical protein A5685_14700 [Mycobacterium colombiense]